MESFRRNMKYIDLSVFGALILLAVYACIAINATTRGNHNPLIPSHVMSKQIMWEIIGMIALVAGMLFDYRLLRRVHWWVYGISMVLLVAVFAFPAVQGAHSWIRLHSLSVQPSELAKLALIIWLATFMANVEESEVPDYRLRKQWIIFPIFLVPFALTYKEPALGQALVMIAIVLTMYTVFARRASFLVIMGFVVVIVAACILATTIYTQQTLGLIQNVLIKHHLLKAYQSYRILTWLDPSFSQDQYGYNIHMAQTAIGSGQLFGEGYGKGVLTSGGWVPNQWTDYIFSAIGEEFGFVGSAILVLLFLVLCYRLIRIAQTTIDPFGMYIAIGVVGMFSFQVFENIGADMYLSPSTGITLPFISYGGTSLAIDYLAVGLVLSVGLRRRKIRFQTIEHKGRSL
ncbi:rod shape determining protein RodA [Alicyclobacillus sacchari]|uniref:Rod shape determining protein RodA n=2 Tax=Alicyclobacillus sacchari TaxID=392010 RepID=A0A4R8LSG1_9BACL|nr:FtsW/RodA/SpoVE family cell cycle protein [Alicyclobacillus sacchari]TDY49516.1 rod shape determining protein RodA [Alicyclobacillus sacchari]